MPFGFIHINVEITFGDHSRRIKFQQFLGNERRIRKHGERFKGEIVVIDFL